MIQECNNIQFKNMVENYIGNEYYKCLYLYMDLKKYGIEFDNVKTWIQFDEKNYITAVFLKYYTGLHVYSKNKNFDIEELAKFIFELKPTMICGEKQTLKLLEKSFLNKGYECEEGWVRRLDSKINNEYNEVNKAEKRDFAEIAKLIYEDEDLGSSYNLQELEKQLYERNAQGFVRNYVIRDNNKVVAHAGTGAEDDKVSMLGYVITDIKYRGKRISY